MTWQGRPVLAGLVAKVNPTFCMLIMLAIAGMAVLAFATGGWGIGVTYDSVYYLDAARHLAAGEGLTTSINGELKLLAHWPPLYPVLLAGPAAVGVDPLQGARWLNILLFGANVMLVGCIVRYLGGGQAWATALAALLTVTAPDLLAIHARAWSEPTFIFFGLLALCLVSLHIERGSVLLFLGVAVTNALAFASRYAGVPLVVTSAAVTWMFGKGSLWKRTTRAGALGVLASLPILWWVIRILRGAGTEAAVRARGMSWHPATREHFESAGHTLRGWLFPDWVPEPAAWVLIVVPLVLGTWTAVSAARKINWEEAGLGEVCRRAFPFCTFVICYVGFLIASISVYDAATPLNYRILSPVYAIGLVLVLSLTSRLLFAPRPEALASRALIVLCGVLACSNAIRGGKWAIKAHSEGLSWSSRAWQESPLVRSVRQLPPETPIFSNYPPGVYHLTGRPALMMPRAVSDAAGRGDDTSDPELRDMIMELSRNDGRLVYLRGAAGAEPLPTEEELDQRWPVQLLQRAEHGAMYAFDPSSGQ
jgi:hypothetical protein